MGFDQTPAEISTNPAKPEDSDRAAVAITDSPRHPRDRSRPLDLARLRRHRSFLVAQRDQPGQTFAGFGLTLDDVIRMVVDVTGFDGDDSLGVYDLCIWESDVRDGDTVAAVVRLHTGTGEYQVFKVNDDGGAAPPSRPAAAQPEPVAAADDDDHDDDGDDNDADDPPPRPPAGRRPGPVPHMHLGPLPLFRQKMTVYPHWDTSFGAAWPFTIEVIVTTDGSDDEPTAQPGDIPELQEGGWSSSSIGIMNVFTRIIN